MHWWHAWRHLHCSDENLWRTWRPQVGHQAWPQCQLLLSSSPSRPVISCQGRSSKLPVSGSTWVCVSTFLCKSWWNSMNTGGIHEYMKIWRYQNHWRTWRPQVWASGPKVNFCLIQSNTASGDVPQVRRADEDEGQLRGHPKQES